MDLESLRALLEGGRRDAAADAALWNGQADEFAGFELPDWEADFTLRLLKDADAFHTGDAVLDVGCGAGKYAVTLRKAGARVTGIDISDRMLAHAATAMERHGVSGATFLLDDFHACHRPEWRGAFDLVLANNTPAIQTAEDLDRMSSYSRRDVVLLKPARRTDSVTDEVLRIAGTRNRPGPKNWVPATFSYLWLSGYAPEIRYDKRRWESARPLGKAIPHFLNRARTFASVDERTERAIADYLVAIAENGAVREVIDTTIVALHWRVERKGNGNESGDVGQGARVSRA